MLKSTKEFDFVYKNSYKFRSEMLDICVLKPNLAAQFYAKFRRIPCNLVGFSVSKKVGIAVERNLIKRRLRAICREFFKVANSPCSDFLGSASSRSLQRTASASHSLVSHNPKNSSTMLEFADSKDSNESSLRDSQHESKQSKNLICIFIAKSGIVQMPFSTLKESIFATLKKQMRFAKNDAQINRKPYKTHNSRESSVNLKSTNHANRAHAKAGQQ